MRKIEEIHKIKRKYHFLQNLGNLKDRKVYTNEMREQCEKETPSVLWGESSYSSFQYYDRNRILTNEEIGEMSPKISKIHYFLFFVSKICAEVLQQKLKQLNTQVLRQIQIIVPFPNLKFQKMAAF